MERHCVVGIVGVGILDVGIVGVGVDDVLVDVVDVGIGLLVIWEYSESGEYSME